MAKIALGISKDIARDSKKFDRQLANMSRAVRQFGDKDLRREMTQASREAAKVAVPYVQEFVPEKSGDLKRNIKAAGTKTTPRIRAGTKTKGGPYAWIVHGGHKTRGGGYVEPVPFLRQGIQKAWPYVILAFLEGQKRAIRTFNRKYKVGDRGKITRRVISGRRG